MLKKQFLSMKADDDARIDWGIIFCILVLAVIGMVSIYVAVKHDTSTASITRVMLSQAIWYTLGAIIVIFLMQFDAEQLCQVGPIAS